MIQADFKNKVYLVTGANGRLGFALSEKLINLGAKVVMADLYTDKISKLNNNNFHIVKKIDLIKEKNIDKIIKISIKKYKKIDGVIHCAYPSSKDWMQSMKKRNVKNLKDNLFNQLGVSILLSELFINYFLNKKIHGKIILISSIQGVRSPKFNHYKGLKMKSPVEYSVMKSGIISLTSYLAKLYKKDKITINCVSPGGIKDGQPKKFIKRYKQSCGSKGLLDPKDIIGAITFLLSNSSKFINGQNIIVDDGWSL